MRILMIEDDATAADYAAKGLSESGHVCDVLADAPHVREVVRCSTFPLFHRWAG